MPVDHFLRVHVDTKPLIEKQVDEVMASFSAGETGFPIPFSEMLKVHIKQCILG